MAQKVVIMTWIGPCGYTIRLLPRPSFQTSDHAI